MGRGGKKDKLPVKSIVVNESSPVQSKVSQEEWPILVESDLCEQFDKNILTDSDKVEGIQAVRDMFTSISVLGKRIDKSLSMLRDQRHSLQTENAIYSETRTRDSDELMKKKSQKDRLQSLCDELSKNKTILIENSQKNSLDDQVRRQAMNDEFLATISTISGRLDASSAQRLKHAEENDSLKSRLRVVLAQYQTLTDDYDAKLKAIDEKVSSALALFSIQEQAYLKEKDITDQWQNRIATMSDTESALRKELSSYADRFEQFQESMKKSNDMFVNCKSSIEEMTRATKKLEAENAVLSKEASDSNSALEAATAETQSIQNELDKVLLQTDKLQGLVNVLKNDISENLHMIDQLQSADQAFEECDVSASVTTIVDSVVRRSGEPNDLFSVL